MLSAMSAPSGLNVRPSTTSPGTSIALGSPGCPGRSCCRRSERPRVSTTARMSVPGSMAMPRMIPERDVPDDRRVGVQRGQRCRQAARGPVSGDGVQAEQQRSVNLVQAKPSDCNESSPETATRFSRCALLRSVSAQPTSAATSATRTSRAPAIDPRISSRRCSRWRSCWRRNSARRR